MLNPESQYMPEDVSSEKSQEKALLDELHAHIVRDFEGERDPRTGKILRKGYRPQLEDFHDIFPSDEIARDKELVRMLEAKWEKDPGARVNQEASELLEGLLAIDGAEEGWFGEETYVVPVSKYDDYKNGVDFVLEIPQRNGVLRIGVDVTLSRDNSVLNHKKAREGLTALKYFSSEAEERTRGIFEGIPRVVVDLSVSRKMKKAELLALKVRRGDQFSRNLFRHHGLREEVINKILDGLDRGLKSTLNGDADKDNPHQRQQRIDTYKDCIVAVKDLVPSRGEQ